MGNDTNLATGSSIVLDAGNPGQDYLWNTNATTQTIIVTTGGIYSVTVTDTAGCSGTDTIKVSFGTAVNNINKEKQQWVLYPNPTKENIVLSTDNAGLLHSKAVLTDMSGKVIAVYMIDKKRQPLNLSGLNSGIYLLMMENGEVFKVGKE